MIWEDDKKIYIENKEEDLLTLNMLNFSRYGSNSNIYYYNNSLLKIYNYYADKDEIKNLEIISKLKIDNVSIPKKFVYINNKFYGYSMDYKSGKMLIRINSNIKYNDIIKNLSKIDKTIKIFSEKKIEMIDINCLNILFDDKNKEFNIIDVDCYKENKLESIEKIYKDNLYYFEATLLRTLLFTNSIKNTYIYDILKNMVKIDIIKNKDIKDIFINIKCYLENYYNREINTIKDLRKVLKKYNN